jgi:hypothetical protein
MALYLVLLDDGRDDTLHCYKCTGDPETPANWTSQDTYVLDGPIKSVWGYVQSSDIHIAVAGINERDAFAYVKYLKFDPGTDLFVQLDATNNYYDERVDNLDAIYAGESSNGDRCGATIAVRSDGDVLIPYMQLSGGYRDVAYSRKESGSWTRGTSLITGASFDHTGVAAMICPDSDRTHVFTVRSTAGRAKSISSTNGLGTDQAISGVEADTEPFMASGYDYGGTDRVVVGFRDSSGDHVEA